MSGRCCGGGDAGGEVGAGGVPCGRPCRTRFSLCLKEYQSAAAPGACSFGRAASPRSFTLILQAYDDYNYTDPDKESGLIEEAWWSGIVEPGAAWHALRHAGAAAALAYRVRVTCQPNYYNSTCTSFCRARDDQFGHYACSAAGDKHCLRGWQGDNCEIRCHPTHGRCDSPGECVGRAGAASCARSASPTPDASTATATAPPGTARVTPTGAAYSVTKVSWPRYAQKTIPAGLNELETKLVLDLNFCGTHEPCQHGGTCENTAPDQYLCKCAEGFSGVDCERVDNPCAPQPCDHGTCALAAPPPAAPAGSPAPAAAPSPGFVCTCERGWGGARCDQDIDDCAAAPCRHGGTCRDRLDAFVCDCPPGWTGATCADVFVPVDVDECSGGGAGPAEAAVGAEGGLGPCVNAAACNNSAGGYSCACLPGWTGRDCELNVDDCTGQCLHGATCIDLVDDFHCACAAGYAGRTCARDVDDCASRPCRNGGECVDLLDAYRCICPVGFSGLDCEDDRDHCADSPCANGAPCYTAQSDYYCHCAPGWTGKNCTQRAARDLEQQDSHVSVTPTGLV
ncbi:unnamed protein product [Leptidea sinapis]|uniref:Delta-like protein n=1 Tax=Leptidea sinapis TaxID=189913 RepID=A0A5E4Q4N7_9NEOP|nr:unnamed protein product [Leptidea sinapis]